MKKSYAPQIVAALAAVAVTLSVFSSVASLADSDRGALLAAQIKPAQVAAR